MNDLSLRDLERDVESARTRLSKDLSILRSPATVSGFGEDLKREAMQVKDRLVQKAQSSARSAALDWVQELKGRAAANPAAALVIGAGLAWRFIKHPPIATVLIGAGLFSLMRTAPIQSSGQGNVDYFAEAKKNLRDQASDLVDSAKEHSSAAARNVAEQMREAGLEAKDKAQEWASAASDRVQQMTGLKDREPMPALDFDAMRSPRPAEKTQPLPDQEIKNQVLLGAAGLAIAIALGLSFRRRLEDRAS